MNIERRDRRRPAKAQLVVVLLGNDGNQPRHTDAVGTHGQPHRLAILAEHVGGEGVGVFAPQLEDVPNFDTARHDQRTGAVGRWIAFAHLGGLNGAVCGEVAAGHQTDNMAAGLVRPGDPAGAVDYPRVDEIADIVLPQRLWPDITLNQERVLGEIIVVEQRVVSRFQRCAQPFVIDLTVAGHADCQQFGVPSRLSDFD
ncbi:Uncharacterised protein [Mycobacterium tuberculosis]|uniref:Uncharacterized protein n=2 Tax=Mycobacterium tuberculosis TaxID=1773 RepID=A0A0T7LS55_MYCTX|nr:Uncharacterised protein [Mycobacterium tuberculosis]CFE49295.1 Uncharacterised protein [Mycobacterium tuberculosis]COV38056.1 Uncharacterised protein [Mycobacterium tuberculosis]COW07533.1 Uncharacterised protein [Mycobacterium tuberculosis]